MISITFGSPEDGTLSILECPVLSLHDQSVVSLPISRAAGVLINVLVQENHALNQIFDVAKFIILAPLSLLS